MTRNTTPHHTAEHDNTTNRSSDHDHHTPDHIPPTVPQPRRGAVVRPTQCPAERPEPDAEGSHPGEVAGEPQGHTALNVGPVAKETRAPSRKTTPHAMEPDEFYEHHLQRVVSGFTTVISGENMSLLGRIIDTDND